MNEPPTPSLSRILDAAGKRVFHGEDFRDRGFTLADLLVALAIMAVLAATLIPALAASRESTKAEQCLANTRQLTTGWAMYASDNRENLVSSGSGMNGWAQGFMDWTANSDNTNTALLVGPAPPGMSAPALGSYLRNPYVFKDPADNYQSAANPGPRVRSYSMNGALGPGAGPTVEGTAPGNREYYGGNNNATTMSDLVHPDMVFVILDEQADSINDGKFMFDPGYPQGSERWRDLPAGYHNGACCLSLADGHSVIHAWQLRVGRNKTLYPVTCTSYTGSSSTPWGSIDLFISADYEWMDDHMPYR